MAEPETVPAVYRQLHELGLRLHAAAKEFDPSREDGGRSSVITSIDSIIRFLLITVGFDKPAALAPLYRLQYALCDLGIGTVTPMFKPKKVRNRPRVSMATDNFRAVASVAMDMFMEAGVRREDAAARVAEALHRMGYSSRNKPIRRHMVEDWRDRMMTERPAENLAAGRFLRLQSDLKAMFPDDPSAAAQHVLNNLPLIVRPDNPKKPPS
jgi:hypothetical protein